MSTLSYALSGLLARQPLSGYDLAQYMKKRIAPMWSALPIQIYPQWVIHELEQHTNTHSELAEMFNPCCKTLLREAQASQASRSPKRLLFTLISV